jgi:hypothetical protein
MESGLDWRPAEVADMVEFAGSVSFSVSPLHLRTGLGYHSLCNLAGSTHSSSTHSSEVHVNEIRSGPDHCNRLSVAEIVGLARTIYAKHGGARKYKQIVRPYICPLHILVGHVPPRSLCS